MKIIRVLIIITFALVIHADSKAQSIERRVISSAGTSVTAPGLQVDYTLGEIAISTLGSNGLILTQGFHQPQSSFCLGDFNHDGLVNLPDLLLMLSEYGCLSNCGTDLSNDGQVTIDDLLSFLSMFGNICD